MRILALVTDGSGGYGGIAQYNRDLIAALSDVESVESILVSPRSGDRAAPTNSKVAEQAPIGGRLRYSLRAAITAIRYRPDLIFCGHLFMAPLAWLLARTLRRPWWLQIHGIEAWEKPGTSTVVAKDPFPTWFPIRQMVESADLVTAVSRHTRRRFLSWANISPDKVRVLPNTYTPPAPFRVVPGECEGSPPTTPAAIKAHLKGRYGLANRKVLLTVSRIDTGDRYKGHDKVLAVLPELIKTHPNLTYVIVGDGDGRRHLESLVDQASLAAHVRFAGRISRDELEDYYRIADVFVMASVKEGFGIVFLEAASLGLPVIGTNSDGSIDALADGVIGPAIEPSPAALVQAIESALAAPNSHAAVEVQRFGRAHVLGQLRILLAPQRFLDDSCP